VVGVVGLALVAGMAGVCGCASYGNYPPIGDDVAENDPNVAPMPEITAAAVRWLVRKYPVEGPYVVNLPQGMERNTGESVLRRIGDPDARLVMPSTKNLPAYHVTKLWLRQFHATVDVLRPVTDMPASSESGSRAINYQLFTIKLEGGGLHGAWRVEAVPRAWPIGTYEPPMLYGWEELPASPSSVTGAPRQPEEPADDAPADLTDTSNQL
jgi:hypothetical protein